MKQVSPGIWVAAGCPMTELPMVHACKVPCHQKALNYSNKLDKAHPHYLSLETADHLYMNMIDPPVPMFSMELFESFMTFAQNHDELVIHCNQGKSRSPSLAMLLMVKRGYLPDESYAAAAAEFLSVYPDYDPGKGIAKYMADNWPQLMEL